MIVLSKVFHFRESPVAQRAEEESTSVEEEQQIRHRREVSDDAETDAMLAAAVAKLDKGDQKFQTKTRKGYCLP